MNLPEDDGLSASTEIVYNRGLMFELAVIIIAIALLTLAFAVVVLLIFLVVRGVTVLAVGYAIMQDPNAGNCNGCGFRFESYSRVDYER